MHVEPLLTCGTWTELVRKLAYPMHISLLIKSSLAPLDMHACYKTEMRSQIQLEIHYRYDAIAINNYLKIRSWKYSLCEATINTCRYNR